MKYLITGASGFVGQHYIRYLLKKNPATEIHGIDTRPPEALRELRGKKIRFYRGSLLNSKWIERIIRKIKPRRIVNLASHSSVSRSWDRPYEYLSNNADLFLNLVEAVRKSRIKTKILSVGSSEEYGAGSSTGHVTEDVPLRPSNPYAVSRVAQDVFANVYTQAYEVPIIATRSFNHIGPGQKEIFVISAFAKQVIEAKRELRNKIVCGDLDIVRDFMDVRDVVRAYDLLLTRGKSGEAYNVSSGKGHRLRDILRELQKKAGTNAKVVSRYPRLMRTADNPRIVGSCKKLRRHTGFKPKYSLSRSLEDILRYWETRFCR